MYVFFVKSVLRTTTLHRKLRTNEIVAVVILNKAVVHNSRSVRKRIGKCRKHFHVCSLHIPWKLWSFTNLLMARRGAVTIEKVKRFLSLWSWAQGPPMCHPLFSNTVESPTTRMHYDLPMIICISSSLFFKYTWFSNVRYCNIDVCNNSCDNDRKKPWHPAGENESRPHITLKKIIITLFHFFWKT